MLTPDEQETLLTLVDRITKRRAENRDDAARIAALGCQCDGDPHARTCPVSIAIEVVADVIAAGPRYRSLPGRDTCKTCRWWDRSDDGGGRVTAGHYWCANIKKLGDFAAELENENADILEYQYREGGGIYTGPEFGCVHHEGAPQPHAAKRAGRAECEACGRYARRRELIRHKEGCENA